MNILVSLKFWQIIAILMSTIGTIMSLLKIIIKEKLGLSDSQVTHPGIADDSVYKKWHVYKELERWYTNLHLFYIGLALIVGAAIIEIILANIKIR